MQNIIILVAEPGAEAGRGHEKYHNDDGRPSMPNEARSFPHYRGCSMQWWGLLLYPTGI